jgi:serine/threonine protein kinase
MLMKAIARVLVRAAVKAGGNAVSFGVAGDAIIEIWDIWNKYSKGQEQKLDEIKQMAEQPAADTRQLAKTLAAEEASDQPEAIRQTVVSYLTQVPAMVRRSMKRPDDPTGRTVRPGLVMLKPEDLLEFLPTKPTRFKPGDCPLPGVDWELEELLGVGGFGEVWKARDPMFGGIPPVALKFCTEKDAAKTLHHEAGVLNQVMLRGKHSGIVQLQHAYLKADPPCLEYEYVAGGDLAGLIKDFHRGTGSYSVESVSRVMAQLAGIVGFAHRLDPPIVHRDLKPANILVQRGAAGGIQLKVADFGIGGVAASQAIKEAGAKPTWLVTAMASGTCTPLYASPQQQAGRPADPRDDVYSLGVIWHQLLTGDLSSGAPTGRGWRARLTEKGMAGPLIDLLESCFEYNPTDRPADAGKLAEEVARLLPAPAGTATVPVSEQPPPSPPSPPVTTLKVGVGGSEDANPGGPAGSTPPKDSGGKKHGARKELTLRVLQRHGLLHTGTEIEVMPDAMPNDGVKRGQAIFRAKIGSLDSQKSVVWIHDGNAYSLTELSVKLEQHGLSWVRPKTFELWRVVGQTESMWVQADKLRSPGQSGGDETDDDDPSTVNKVFGHPFTAVLRWMGKNGWSFEDAKQALMGLGVECSEATVRTQLSAGKTGQRGAPASLTEEQIATLLTALAPATKEGAGGGGEGQSKDGGGATSKSAVDPLHTGEGLAKYIDQELKTKGYSLTKLEMSKIAALNQDGVKSSPLQLPKYSAGGTDSEALKAKLKAKQDAQVELLKKIAPAGTEIKVHKSYIPAAKLGITKKFGEEESTAETDDED